jgi:hypothetical protein
MPVLTTELCARCVCSGRDGRLCGRRARGAAVRGAGRHPARAAGPGCARALKPRSKPCRLPPPSQELPAWVSVLCLTQGLLLLERSNRLGG